MKKISSFTVDHDRLERGIYVSRIDGDIVTYDLRMRRPNAGDYITPLAAHSLEHLLATYMRSGKAGDRVIYVGPMGCRTGCYVLMFGDLNPEDIYDFVIEMCDFIIAYEGEIPGAAPEQCGNYSEQNMAMAKYYIKKYKKELEENKRFIYPN